MIREYVFLILVVLSMALAGCVEVAPATGALATSTPAVDNVGPMEEASGTAPDGQVTELAFAGNGDTFLDEIASTLREAGDPEHHRYVELEAGAGQIWQGEALDYPEHQVVFLQPLQGGSDIGVRLESQPGDSLQAYTQYLPETEVASALPDVDIQFVRARHTGDNNWTFDVTVAHPDTGWADYVDGWHVETVDGEILGTRILLHPHVGEQPFTRSLSRVSIPESVTEVIIRSHDLVSGYSSGDLIINLGEANRSEQVEVVR
jgi:hypothetical protein